MRRLAAEFFGTALLLCAVVGSGIFAEEITQDAGIRLIINATSIGLALAVLIWWFGAISGAHFNPVVTIAAAIRRDLPLGEAAGFIGAQILGGIAGAVASNAMFSLQPVQTSTHERLTTGTFVSEILATACLIAIISALGARGQGNLAPVVIGAWITSAIYFTSSTTFANPAVTIARIFTDTMTGINPSSAAGFVAAQLIGLPVGLLFAKFFSEARNS